MRPLCAILACAVAWGPLMAVAEPVETYQPVQAQVAAVSTASVSDAPDRVEVVVYRSRAVDTADLMQRSRYAWSQLDREGLALIVETRTVDIPAGEGVIQFKGLATGIVPHSATLEGLPADLVEQNADYELITPFNLLDRAVGQTVSVVRTNATTGREETHQAIVRAGQNGTVLEIDGQFEALDCSGLTERVVFNEVPEGLGATPTLSVRTRATQGGRHTVTLAYLATGLQWSADYVANLNDDGRTLELQGWITLANFGGTSFPNAPVTVVAGDLSMTGDSVPVQIRQTATGAQCWPQGRTNDIYWAEYRNEYLGPPMMAAAAPPKLQIREAAVEDIVVTASRVKAQMEELGDYKAYVLPHPTTVAAKQMKQVLFFAQNSVPFEWVHSLYLSQTEADEAAETAQIELLMRNEAELGLGLPVPEGKATLMRRDPVHGPMLAGEAGFRDTPVGLPLRLRAGEDAAVTGQFTLTQEKSRGRGAWRKAEEVYQVVLANGSPEAVSLEVLLPTYVSAQKGFRIRREGMPSRIDPDRGLRVWTLELAAGDERSFEVRWSYDDPQ